MSEVSKRKPEIRAGSEYREVRLPASVVPTLAPQLASGFRAVAFLLAYLLGGTALAESSSDLVLQNWEIQSRLRCPRHHVEQLCDECYIDVLDKFEASLPKKTQRRIEKVADTSRVCKDEVAGFSCEMSANLGAYEKLGLMPDFIAFGCDHVSCEEDSGCAIK